MSALVVKLDIEKLAWVTLMKNLITIIF